MDRAFKFSGLEWPEPGRAQPLRGAASSACQPGLTAPLRVLPVIHRSESSSSSYSVPLGGAVAVAGYLVQGLQWAGSQCPGLRSEPGVLGRRGRPASLGTASASCSSAGPSKVCLVPEAGGGRFLLGRRSFPVSEGLCFLFFSSGWVPMPRAGMQRLYLLGWASPASTLRSLCTRGFHLSCSLQEKTPCCPSL